MHPAYTAGCILPCGFGFVVPRRGTKEGQKTTFFQKIWTGLNSGPAYPVRFMVLLKNSQFLRPASFTPLRWAESFYAIAPVMMGRVLNAAGIDEDPFMLIVYLMGESIDPNVSRERLLSPWVKAANSQA